ncbi:MAG TPA: hypothetical protein VEA58_09275 [Anaerovoracaceae bacterium]|nr:hypothetical protein [Anaerovoracaceae bacterium]
MKRLVITNNKKVEFKYQGKVEVVMLDNSSDLKVLETGLQVASKGGRLLMDPTRRKGYYKSLIFYVENEDGAPDEKSITLLKKCIDEASKQGNAEIKQESILAGILQNRDLSLVRSVVN